MIEASVTMPTPKNPHDYQVFNMWFFKHFMFNMVTTINLVGQA